MGCIDTLNDLRPAGQFGFDSGHVDGLEIYVGRGVVGEAVALSKDAPNEFGIPFGVVAHYKENGGETQALELVKYRGGVVGVGAVIEGQEHVTGVGETKEPIGVDSFASAQ